MSNSDSRQYLAFSCRCHIQQKQSRIKTLSQVLFEDSLIADVRGETVRLVIIHLLLDGCSSRGAVTWEVRVSWGLTGRKRSAAVRQSEHQETSGCVWSLNWKAGSIFSCQMNDSPTGCLVCLCLIWMCDLLNAVNHAILKWGFCHKMILH